MGEPCQPWTYKHSLSIVFILVSTACLGHCSENPAGVGKVYPRGNQWAVGHLMGKKSIDYIFGPEESHRDSDYLINSEEDQLLDRRVLIRALVRALVGLDRTRQREEQENDTYLKETETYYRLFI